MVVREFRWFNLLISYTDDGDVVQATALWDIAFCKMFAPASWLSCIRNLALAVLGPLPKSLRCLDSLKKVSQVNTWAVELPN